MFSVPQAGRHSGHKLMLRGLLSFGCGVIAGQEIKEIPRVKLIVDRNIKEISENEIVKKILEEWKKK